MEISKHHPQPRDLTDLIVREGNFPTHGGSYADVYMGRLPGNGAMTKVAIKVIRPHIYSEVNKWKIDKRLRREISVWSRLAHSNVIPLLGIATDFGPYTAMVSPWMDEGDLYTYLRNSKTTLGFTSRMEVLSQIAEGLCYLHSQFVIHGDLMPSNVLMDLEGNAHLADFGLSNVVADVRGPSFMTSKVGGSVRWAALELFQNEVNHTSGPELTTHCDVYSFGSVALYVLSGQIPYENLPNDTQVLREIIKGNRPPRPSESPLTDSSWNFIQSCWSEDPSERPNADRIRELLSFLRSWEENFGPWLDIQSFDIGRGDLESEDYAEPPSQQKPAAVPCKYRVGKTLSRGTYAIVKEAVHIDTGKYHACKVINKRLMEGRKHMVRNEIRVFQRMSSGHPNIVTLHDYFETAYNVYLCFHLCTGDDLYDRTYAKGRYCEVDSRALVRTIFTAVKYIHDAGIVHRGLNPGDLIFCTLAEDADIMIADFGFSTVMQERQLNQLSEICGTPGYMAPEIFQKTGYGKPVDVWAMGVITYFLLAGYMPFNHDLKQQGMGVIIEADYLFELECWQNVSEASKDFVLACLTIDPAKRPTAAQALEHKWLAYEKH